MNKNHIVAQVSLVIKIKNALTFVGVNKSPTALLSYFKNLESDKTSTEDFVKIFKAIEDEGIINPINEVTWKKIYDTFGVQFPVNKT